MSNANTSNVTAQRGAGASSRKTVIKVPSVTVRFAGDSGDGMQLAGMQFADASALAGNDIATLPDYPAEIRAPAGTVAGVSGYQVRFASTDIYTPGEEVDALVAMNPAALRSNLKFLRKGGILIVNSDAFTPAELKKAGYSENPLDTDALSAYRLIKVPIDSLNRAAVKDSGLSAREAERCKNFFTLGLVYWLYDRPLEPTLRYIDSKFGRKSPAVALANAAALKAGYNYAETAEYFQCQFQVEPAKLAPGTYRKITGNEAVALGMVAAAKLAGKTLFYASYPITPASEILHTLAELKNFGVITFQAEDEICAMGAAIGAAFGGAIACTGTSGPGMSLKTEAIGLAVMTELPVVIINVQRAGPSTGMPTKPEQADLLQAMWGRHGESPVPVIAAASPADCFQAAIEATTIAVRYMTPVILLSDGFLGNSAEPWLIPDVSSLPRIEVSHPDRPNDPVRFMPYKRNADLARPWCIPGTPQLEHRIGGLEKQDVTGNVSHDPANHDKMCRLRAQKVAGIKPAGRPYVWDGPESGRVLLVGWGGTFGAIRAATESLRSEGLRVAHCHLRYLNPLPSDLGEILRRFDHVFVVEMNLGQLATVLRAAYLIDVRGINRVTGQPLGAREVVEAVKATLAG